MGKTRPNSKESGYCNRCWWCNRYVEGGMCTRKHPDYNHDLAIERGYVVEKSSEL